MRVQTLASFSFLASLVAAHGSRAELKREAAAHNAFLKTRGVTQCLGEGSKLQKRHLARREADLHAMRKRNLERRGYEENLARDHHSNITGLTPEVDSKVLFNNASCVLHPETTEGPYYIQGEHVRTKLSEDQQGVPFYAELLVIDVNSCEPVPNAYVEFWGANATGVYSAVVAKGNGNIADTSNVDNSFCRGVQVSDSDGVVKFETIFPGHYEGRTSHVHVVTHTGNDVIKYPNETISWNSSISHVGQFFFDESLRERVRTVPPYSTNQQVWITNREDEYINETSQNGADPFMTYAYLGDEVQDGVMGWIVMGIDAKAVRDVNEAGYLTENGGVFLGTQFVRGQLVGGHDPKQPNTPDNLISSPYPPPKEEEGAGQPGQPGQPEQPEQPEQPVVGYPAPGQGTQQPPQAQKPRGPRYYRW